MDVPKRSETGLKPSTVSDGFRPVSDLFGMSTNFHTIVGSADIAAFLQFQTVSDLFQTSLGCPQISIQM